jgi:hypothetical protein
MNRRSIVCLTMLIALTASARPAPPQSSGEREFVGTINNTLRVRLRLSQSGKSLSGSYVYERIGKSLRLNGAMTSEKEFYLNEFDEGGKLTGRFEGKFVTEDWIEGSWSSVKAKEKSTDFEARDLNGKQIPNGGPNDKISGEYKRVFRGSFDRDTAVLDVWLLKDGRVRVAGQAIWVGNIKTGNVNEGSVDGVFPLRGNRMFYKETDSDNPCSFAIAFGVNSLTVTFDHFQCGGINVTFDGKYRKVGPPKFPPLPY